MPSENTKILEFNQYHKSDRASFIIHADLECLIEKIDGYKNYTEHSSITKLSEHIPSGFTMSTISLIRKRKLKKNKIQIGYKFLIIHTEY